MNSTDYCVQCGEEIFLDSMQMWLTTHGGNRSFCALGRNQRHHPTVEDAEKDTVPLMREGGGICVHCGRPIIRANGFWRGSDRSTKCPGNIAHWHHPIEEEKKMEETIKRDPERGQPMRMRPADIRIEVPSTGDNETDAALLVLTSLSSLTKRQKLRVLRVITERVGEES